MPRCRRACINCSAFDSCRSGGGDAVVSAREMERFCRKFAILSQFNPGWDARRLVQAFLVDHWIEIRHHESPEIFVDKIFAEFLKRKHERGGVYGQSAGSSTE
jgi:hypothetical protein